MSLEVPIFRREVLRGAMAGAALFLNGGGPLLCDEPLKIRRQPSGLKLSCSSLAFSDKTWDSALEEIKKLGFRYADLAMFEGWTHVSPSELSDPEAHGKKIAAACEKLLVEPIAVHASFSPPGLKGFPGLTAPDPKARKTVLEHFHRVVLCARTAEVPLVNVQPGKFIEGLSREACLKNAV